MKKTKCVFCAIGSKSASIKCYEHGTAYFDVKKEVGGFGLVYDFDNTEGVEELGFYCNACSRELTEKQVRKILGVKP